MHLSKKEVAKYIENFLHHEEKKWDWDDFISIKLDDTELEKIRLECAGLPDKFPAIESGSYCSKKGMDRLRELLLQLK